MITRRAVLEIGVGTAMMGACVPAPVGQPSTQRFYKAVIDERYLSSAYFAEEARKFGIDVQPIRGDITDVWFSDLYKKWKEGVAVAGFTGCAGLYCLSEFARDAGLRVIYHAEHMIAPDGSARHRVFGSSTMRARAALLDESYGPKKWASRAARIALNCPEEDVMPTSVNHITDLFRAGDRPNLVTSWVIAPV